MEKQKKKRREKEEGGVERYKGGEKCEMGEIRSAGKLGGQEERLYR